MKPLDAVFDIEAYARARAPVVVAIGRLVRGQLALGDTLVFPLRDGSRGAATICGFDGWALRRRAPFPPARLLAADVAEFGPLGVALHWTGRRRQDRAARAFTLEDAVPGRATGHAPAT